MIENKDLRWVRPEFEFGSDKAEKPARKNQKASKSEIFVDDGTHETFTVAEIASMWKYSTDTVQRIFADEPGVISKGDKNPRGKRKRITLRIPRTVMERVKKRLANR